MIKYTTGNIIRCETEAIVNTVNTQGVMGKGIALAFKEAFPLNFKQYEIACKEGTIDIGKLFLTETGELYPKYIINFPTKKHWRFPSKYEYIESGLNDLIRIIKEKGIKSISIPPLGAGNGRLDWIKVKIMIQKYLQSLSEEIEIVVFEPIATFDKPDKIVKEVGLTDARAIFIYILWNYQILGDQINLLVAQKIAYFMQKFGENLNLDFEKGIYGPYSNRLNHLLKHINGTYIEFDERNNSPATDITINQKKFEEVIDYYQNRISIDKKNRVEKVLCFIDGFESAYGLELLATIDFIIEKTGKNTPEGIQEEICNWTKRKKELMKPTHIKVALSRLAEFNLN
ncbi:MAG: macro domain-containing protein [Candidatus Kapabacteria bacterium]|nr:macro domain-containing protein [Candidatus Kapabacteria bacterium]